ncbi:MAG: pilus assembly protein TadG-related protein [Candidatus Nanopelagicales bacterium]
MRRDEGTVLITALGGVLLVLLVTLVLADTSNLFMRRSALLTVADTAALAAANAVDLAAVYSGGVDDVLRLDPQAARNLAQAAVDGVDDARLTDVRLEAVDVNLTTVEVTVSAAVPALISGFVTDDSLRIRASAAAAMPTRL